MKDEKTRLVTYEIFLGYNQAAWKSALADSAQSLYILHVHSQDMYINIYILIIYTILLQTLKGKKMTWSWLPILCQKLSEQQQASSTTPEEQI